MASVLEGRRAGVRLVSAGGWLILDFRAGVRRTRAGTEDQEGKEAMAGVLRDFRIPGVHPVNPTAEELAEAVELQWGGELDGEERERAEESTREHFAGLFLIEVQVDPPDAEVDWGEVTQRVEGVDPSNWQAPYDERLIDEGRGRWAFFLHCVQLDQELLTPAGPRRLPSPTAMPVHLSKVQYELP